MEAFLHSLSVTVFNGSSVTSLTLRPLHTQEQTLDSHSVDTYRSIYIDISRLVYSYTYWYISIEIYIDITRSIYADISIDLCWYISIAAYRYISTHLYRDMSIRIDRLIYVSVEKYRCVWTVGVCYVSRISYSIGPNVYVDMRGNTHIHTF
jgi:hypothetical protein